MVSCQPQNLLTPFLNKNVPKHVAIIMDGNRRWAKQANKRTSFGHESGAEVVEKIITRAIDWGLETLTLFAFSTENWKRSRLEINFLFSILTAHLQKMKPRMERDGVRFHTIGDLNPLPKKLKELINEVKTATKNNTKINIVLALNYGSRDEITRVVKRLIHEVNLAGLEIKDINESLIDRYLDTSSFSDPDLIIRTSGENRMSNFLLWQGAYSEFFTTSTYWPDFTIKEFDEALLYYSNRSIRKGV